MDLGAIERTIDAKTKLLFVCSPNNPTGNKFDDEDVKSLLKTFGGIVVVDEAYVQFSDGESLVGKIKNYPNAVI